MGSRVFITWILQLIIMQKKGTKVRIVGSCLVNDFAEGIVTDSYCEMYTVQCDKGTLYIDERYVFKDNSFNLLLLKLFKHKKYAEYKRTHKECTEV